MVTEAGLCAFAFRGAIVCARALAFSIFTTGRCAIVFVVTVGVTVSVGVAEVFTSLSAAFSFFETCGPHLHGLSVEGDLAGLGTACIPVAKEDAAIAGLSGFTARGIVTVMEAAGAAAIVEITFV